MDKKASAPRKSRQNQMTFYIVRSNSWDVQLAAPNDSRYARLEKNLGIWQVGVKDITHNGRRDPKCPSARRHYMLREDTWVPYEGATCAWMAADEAVGSWRCGGLPDNWSAEGILSLVFV
ncbi:hypothetical protein TNCV_1297931 [Trichonephila clavipes]|nr:hypothetical protein TNCV_1297931 [Trichonephila clavipes]